MLDDIFAAGDVARWPHPVYGGLLLAVEHWGNAVEHARTAAHNMVCAPADRRVHKPVPVFWSTQFGLNIKSVGLPTIAEQVAVVQGAVDRERFVAVYGHQGRTVAAVAVNMPRWVAEHQALIEAGAPFPPHLHAAEGPAEVCVLSAGIPQPGQTTHSAVAAPTGPGPSAPPPEAAVRAAATDPRTPPVVPPL